MYLIWLGIVTPCDLMIYFFVLGPLNGIKFQSVFWDVEQPDVKQIAADHHSSSALASLAVNRNYIFRV